MSLAAQQQQTTNNGAMPEDGSGSPAEDTQDPPVNPRPPPNTLPLLNVIVITSSEDDASSSATCDHSTATTTTTTDQELQPTSCSSGGNKTKKFYESDSDTFIQAIFSQTITSTTVTPTDEDISCASMAPQSFQQQQQPQPQPQHQQQQQPERRPPQAQPDEDDDDDDDVDEGLDLDLEDATIDDDEDLNDATPDEHLMLLQHSLSQASNLGGSGSEQQQLLQQQQPTHLQHLTPTNLSQHGGDVSQLTDTMDGYQETMISFCDVLGLEHDGDDGGGGGGGGGGDERDAGDCAGDETVDLWQRDEPKQASYFDQTIVDDEDDGEDAVNAGHLAVTEEEEEEEEDEDDEEDDEEVSEELDNDDDGEEPEHAMQNTTTLLETSNSNDIASTLSSSSTKTTTTKKIVKKKKSITSTLSIESTGGADVTTTTTTTTTTLGNGSATELGGGDNSGAPVVKKVKKLVKKKSVEASVVAAAVSTVSSESISSSSNSTELVAQSTEVSTSSSSSSQHLESAVSAAKQPANGELAAEPKPKKKTKKAKKSDVASKENISVSPPQVTNGGHAMARAMAAQNGHENGGIGGARSLGLFATGLATARKSTAPLLLANSATTLPRSARYGHQTAQLGSYQQRQLQHQQLQAGNQMANAVGPRIVPSGMQMYEDDLSNIDVKSLKKLYLPNSASNSTSQDATASATASVSLPPFGDPLPVVELLQQRHFVSREVSVKHLCRSFGDLTALSDAAAGLSPAAGCCNGSPTASGSKTRSVGAAGYGVPRVAQQSTTPTLPRIHRDSYCNLVGIHEMADGAGAGAGCGAAKGKYSRVKFGIKQFDMKSSFSKFDALQKKSLSSLSSHSNSVLHVRSSDAGKAQEKFSGLAGEPEKNCRACQKPVFKMEEVKAERNIYHRTCFKCSECTKQLNVDTYESHESILYCKPHFRALFTPKAVEETDPVKPRKPELIIRENQPLELPPDVVRSSDKADLGLDELHQLDVKSRFQAFELGAVHNTASHADSAAAADTAEELLRLKGVRRSASVSSKLARFQQQQQRREKLNGGGADGDADADGDQDAADDADGDDDDEEDQYEAGGGRDSATEADETGEDIDLVRAKRAQRERPLSFANMSEMRNRFEAGAEQQRDERREECKQELQNIRSRLFRGQQAKIKERYQAAVEKSEQGVRAVDRGQDAELGELAERARAIKDRFERGQAFGGGGDGAEAEAAAAGPQSEEWAVFEQGLGKQSRSIFMEMDANVAAAASAQHSPSQPQTPRTPDTRCGQRSGHPLQASASAAFVAAAAAAANAAASGEAVEVVRAADRPEDVRIETADISNKFKFFETYKPAAGEKKQFRITPPRDGVVKLPSPERDDDDDDDEDDEDDYEAEVYGGDAEVAAATEDGRQLEAGATRNGGGGGTVNGGGGQANGGQRNGNGNSKVVRNKSSRRQKQHDPIMLQNSSTTTKMLSMFRQMEEGRNEQQHYDGMKPLKCFTPPPDNNRRRLRTGNSESENDCTDSEDDNDNDDDGDEDDDEEECEGEEEEEEEELDERALAVAAAQRNGDYVRSSDKSVDEFLLQAKNEARAKQLRAKFERWETREIAREQLQQQELAASGQQQQLLLHGAGGGGCGADGSGEDQSQVETAKEIRAKFESMRTQSSFTEAREKIKVNRFL